MDAYWKGLVTQIKTLTSHPDALVNVCWFWEKKDIVSAVEGLTVDPELTK